jgi:Tfp pilus assembly protein PilX
MSAGRVRRQRGVASLVVVMVLFLIVSLVAAYASRNLIFEQRTGTNQYRSTQALEAAEAGLEWGLTMLNSGRIDASCQTSALAGDTSFRGRYLSFSTEARISPLRGPVSNAYLYPTCVLDGSAWSCSCPSDGPPTLTPPTSAGLHPAFRLYFRSIIGAQPGVVQLWSNGCTKLDDNCLKFDPTIGGTNGPPSTANAASGEGVAVVSVIAAIAGSVASPPVNALTAGGNVDLGGAALSGNIAVANAVFTNNKPAPSPYVIHAGGMINTTNMVLRSMGGIPVPDPASAVLANDDLVGNLGADRMFAATFNMTRATFANQQAAVTLQCGLASCNADAVRTAALFNPGRPILVVGDLALDSPGDIGSANEPVLINVTGNVDFGSSGVTIYGVLYVQAATWASAGAATVVGATIAEGNIGGNMTATFTYNSDIVRKLRASTGTFVRVPGSWQDFQPGQ